ncbi:hypothetical protein ACJMK2_030579 [Sinanodonta woodiana]|uniref:RBR-type E3 ubiquitin transferase n=1 Tax=Sinanodonta woodiana TaxID=1069815 RepID=A0ABD3WW60_SINWO
MTDQEEQEDELLALTSIYDEEILTLAKEGDGRGGQLLVYPHLPDHFIIKSVVKETKKNEENSIEIKEEKSHEIKYLPPLSLSFQLPSNYPSHSPPNFTLACKWLNRKQLTDLCKKLDYTWEENKGSVVLFMWANFLQEELFQFLEISSPMELATVITLRKDTPCLDTRAIQEVASQGLLLPAILEYDKQMKKREFDRSIFTCKVCFSDVVGAKCISFLGCGHIYCSDCMRDYFSVQIQEANVRGLECPEEKCESQAHPSQVKQLVTPELFAKYEKLLLQTCLDMMVDVIYCPRPACQCPVLLDRESSMCVCPDCRFVFCTLCLFTYHGLSPCKLKADGIKKLKEEYEKGDQATRQLLEKRYGKATIKQALEESFTREWLDKFSKQCPSCGSCIQKIDGCNKMTCMKCRAYFCWICMGHLSNSNPYKHYNTEDSPCFNRLFEGVDMDDFDEDDEDWWN